MDMRINCSRILYGLKSLSEVLYTSEYSKATLLSSCCAAHNCFIIDYCLPIIFNETKSASSEVHKIYEVTLAFIRITAILSESSYLLDEKWVSKLVAFILQHIDFTVEIIGFRCVSVLENLIILHQLTCSLCKNSNEPVCHWTDLVRKSLTSVRTLKKCRARALLRSFFSAVFRTRI